MRVPALLLALGLLVSGCLQGPPTIDDGEGAPPFGPGHVTDVRDRHLLPFKTDGSYSATLLEGAHAILPAVEVDITFAVPTGKGLPSATVNMGVFLPDVPEGTKVPVVADIGPYYYDLDVGATEPANRLGKFLIENLVPHGYAVAQVSVTGTGKSSGCMDLMGPIEQAGIKAAVEWLASQPWSNGNVGLIGRSYDGSTVWEAAMQGLDPVKTVVPISGLFGQYELMWRNGSAELRGPGLLWAIYYVFATTPAEGMGPQEPVSNGYLVPSPQYAPRHARNLAEHAVCPDAQSGGAQAVLTYLNGAAVAPQANKYWEERYFRERVLANYKGSVYFIHGLQDWNVDPHMAFPFYQELQAKGIEAKGLFGQWGNHYPDRPGEHGGLRAGYGGEAKHASVRWDWAQDLLEWFDYYLKATGAKPALHVEIQDNQGAWRIEDTYPPSDLAWTELRFGKDLQVPTQLAPPLSDRHLVDAGHWFAVTSQPLERETRIAGMPQLHLTVTPLGPGGQVSAQLRSVAPDGKELRLGHATMDLRFAAGGRAPQPVVPGQPIVAKMEFLALDAVVPEGHKLKLVLTQTVEDYLPTPVQSTVQVDVTDRSVLRLPTVDRQADAFFTPPK
jgi:predicted acyl esterase